MLSTILHTAKIKDLFRANKVLKHLKGEDLYLKFPPLKALDDLTMLVFADASYGNLPKGNSQAGYVILLCDSDYSCCPISWSSFRLSRVARSTLSAETLAMSEALDNAILLSKIYGEVLHNKRSGSIPIVALTDSRSLFNASGTTNLIQEKRLRVDIASIRQMIENQEIKLVWIDSIHQIANNLTKLGASARNLQQVLATGKCSEGIIACLSKK